MNLPPTPQPETLIGTSSKPCARCGQFVHQGHGAISGDAQRRICELELQITLLADKATMADDKLADYEDELRHLKARASPPLTSNGQQIRSSQLRTSSQPIFSQSQILQAPSDGTPSSTPPLPATANAIHRPSIATSRFPSFLLSRRTTSPIEVRSLAPERRAISDLEAALAHEQSLRHEAEGKLTQVNGEIEELSSQLFQQAGEMVATERKARARLEERVKILESRDIEKRKRLERLEAALKRLERTRGLLERKNV